MTIAPRPSLNRSPVSHHPRPSRRHKRTRPPTSLMARCPDGGHGRTEANADGCRHGHDKPSPMGGMPAGDQKPMSGKPMDPAADQKPMSGNPKAEGDNKGDQKPSSGQKGGDGKPMTGKSDIPMSGSPSSSKPSSGQPSSGQPSSGQPSSGQPSPKDPAQQDVQEAVPQQKGARRRTSSRTSATTAPRAGLAIRALERAIKELEKRLKQLREKELARLLANLEERVGRMLQKQMKVKAATVSINQGIHKNKNQKTTADVQKKKSQAEAEEEHSIIAEAEKALKLMEGEGSAVVFAGVLREVKGDMEAVERRLNEGRVEKQTQDMAGHHRSTDDDERGPQEGQAEPGEPEEQAAQR